MITRKKLNSSKVNLVISIVFHTLLLAVVFYFGAKQGLFGTRMKAIAGSIVKEKKPEPPKEKSQEPKVEQVKAVQTPQAAPQRTVAAAPPPPSDLAPSVAPPSVSGPSFFNDGAKDVIETRDPNVLYKTLVEYELKRTWNRPEDIADEQFSAEASVHVDPTGRVLGYDWLKGSGNTRWDASVKQALDKMKGFSQPPPKKFPEKILVRFDVEMLQTEPVTLSSR